MEWTHVAATAYTGFVLGALVLGYKGRPPWVRATAAALVFGPMLGLTVALLVIWIMDFG